MMDRFDRAHALRCDIHAWLREHPDSGMASIQAAFAGFSAPTVRKTVQRLAGLGHVAQRGRSTATVYRAVGDAVTPVDAMRKRSLTGKQNLVHSTNTRTAQARAWETRRALHAHIAAHPEIRMAGLVAAFPQIPFSTLNKHLRALRRHDNIALLGSGAGARYRALTARIYELEDVREQLRTNCRNAGMTARQDALREQAVETVPGEPWKTVNYPEKHRPLRHQGGQSDSHLPANGGSPLLGGA